MYRVFVVKTVGVASYLRGNKPPDGVPHCNALASPLVTEK